MAGLRTSKERSVRGLRRRGEDHKVGNRTVQKLRQGVRCVFRTLSTKEREALERRVIKGTGIVTTFATVRLKGANFILLGFPDQPLVEKLSPREKQVALLRAAGLSGKEIARELGLAVGSVSTCLRRARRKLEVDSDSELIFALFHLLLVRGLRVARTPPEIATALTGEDENERKWSQWRAGTRRQGKVGRELSRLSK